METELVRAVAVGGLFLAIFAVAEIWRALGRPPVEHTRKWVHFAGGAVVAAFPWLLRSHWTVLGLALSFGGILWLTRRMGWMQSVHGVARRSEGGLYYPLAVYLLFLFGSHRPVFYLVSILALVVSDTLAALVGTAYGRHTFQAESDRKSLEGSAVFFLSTFLGVHLPLLLLTDVDRAACVLIGVQIALLVTCFEAISLRGNDNLIVPLATYYLLTKLTTKPAPYIAVQLLAQLASMAWILFLAWRFHMFTLAGALGTSLVLYGAMALGGWTYGLPVFLALLGYLVMRMAFQPAAQLGEHQVLAVFYVALVPTAVLLMDNTFAQRLYPVFAAATAGQLGILAYLELVPPGRIPARSALWAALAGGALAWAWVVPLSLRVGGGPWWLTLPPMASALLYHLLRRGQALEGPRLVRLQALATAVPTLVSLLYAQRLVKEGLVSAVQLSGL